MYKASIVCVFILLVACNDEKLPKYIPQFSDVPAKGDIVYSIGIHPLHNPQHLHQIFSPLATYLSDNISGVTFRIEASRNYGAYDKKLYKNKFHFALPNPFQTMNAIDKGYRVFAKMADDQNFRGIILVRKDSNISDVSQLKGKAVSYPAPTALAATMMPQLYLQQNGVNVMSELDNKYVGSQESSIMNVYLSNTIAGATWPPPWIALSKQRPELKEQLEVKWETRSLVNNGFVVRQDVPEKILKQVQEYILNLHKTNEGKVILKSMELSKFELANNETYDVVRKFMKQYNKEVRLLENDLLD